MEEFERELIEQMLDAASLHDTAGVFLYAAPAFEALTGWKPSELVGQSAYAFHHPDDIAVIERDHEATLGESDGQTPEAATIIAYRFRHKDGSYVWVETTSRAYDDGRRIACLTRNTAHRSEAAASTDLRRKVIASLDRLAADRDVPLLRRLGTALAELGPLFEMDIGIVSRIEGQRYEVLAVDAPAEIGIEPHALFELGKTFCDVTMRRQGPVAVENAPNDVGWAGHPCLAATGLESYIGVRLDVSGEPFGTLNFSRPTPRSTRFSSLDRDLISLVGISVAHEIEIEHATASLRQRKREFRQLFEASPVAAILADCGEIERWVVRGAPTEEVESVAAAIRPYDQNAAAAALLAIPDRMTIRRQLVAQWRESFLAGDLENLSAQVAYEDNQGQERHLLLLARVFRAEGRPDFRRVLLSATDVDELQASSLRMLDGERARRLEGLRVLAGGIAHEFNNRLLAIMGHAELARLDVPEDSQLARDLDAILDQSQAASILAANMLSYSGQGPVESRDEDLETLVERTCRDFASTLDAKTRVRTAFETTNVVVRFNPTSLRQALEACLRNAADALASRDAGTITVRLGPSPRQANGVRISIVDDGPGMDDETRVRALDPFFSTKFAGRGLGLAMAQGIVNRHGGTIELQSAPERGTTVLFDLPGRR